MKTSNTNDRKKMVKKKQFLTITYILMFKPQNECINGYTKPAKS